MPFERPTLPELVSRAAADIESRLPGADAKLRRSNLNVLARTHSGAVHGLYGYIDFLSRQIFPDTAETSYLERWGAVWGIGRKPASFATGTVTFAGTDGTAVPAGTLLQRADGAEYATDAEVTIAGGTADATVTAQLAGADGNAAAGVELSLVNSIAGIEGTATVDADGLGAGADKETDASLRDRLLERIQRPPHGGAVRDYEAWAREVAGVTRVWVAPLEQGAGTVTVRFATDDADGGPIPDAVTVQAVQDLIDAERPVTAEVFVVAPIAVPLDPEIALNPDTTTVRAAVEAELQDLLRRDAKPGGTILESRIREAISIAAGESDHDLVSPTGDVTHAAGEMALLGTITWA